jgi:hypothetical protein
VAAAGAEFVAPNILSLLHWERIEQGALYASSSRIDWRSLLRRTFQVDLRVCHRCGGRLSVRAVVSEHDDIERVLDSILRSRDPPPVPPSDRANADFFTCDPSRATDSSARFHRGTGTSALSSRAPLPRRPLATQEPAPLSPAELRSRLPQHPRLGYSLAWPRMGYSPSFRAGSFGTMRGRSFARGASTPWNRVSG